VIASTGFFIRSAPVLALLVVSACGGRRAGSGPAPASSAMVQVENRGFADMVIYAVSGAQRVRLGLATGNSTKSFTIPTTLIRGAGPLRFLADPIGGQRTPISEDIVVQPGDIVTLTIPP
jgi:hypothetical protein